MARRAHNKQHRRRVRKAKAKARAIKKIPKSPPAGETNQPIGESQEHLPVLNYEASLSDTTGPTQFRKECIERVKHDVKSTVSWRKLKMHSINSESENRMHF